jgi:Ca-activated chloride channel family protein
MHPAAPRPRRSFAIDGVLVALTVAMSFMFQPPASIGGETKIGAMGVAAAPARAATKSPVSVTGTLDRTRVLHGGDGTVRVELKITGARGADKHLPRVPTDVVVVLDRSGSMDGSKISWARSAAQELIGLLNAEDRFALVTYSNRSAITIPMASATPENRRRWTADVGRISAGGSTNMADALDDADAILDAARTPGRAARVVLISDGLPTAGDTSMEGLVARARRAVRDEYVLSAVGVGDDFNEHLMTSLADAGTGNFYYLEHGTRLAGVFADEFASSREQVAAALRITIEPAGGVRVVDAAGYPLVTGGGSVWFHPGSLWAGQQRKIWVTLQASTSRIGSGPLASFEVSFADGGGTRRAVKMASLPPVACVEDAQAFARGIDKKKWEESQIQEKWNEVRTKVARQVQLGNKDDALRELRAYKTTTSSLNAMVQSDHVVANLLDVDELEATVEEAFSGAARDQKAKRSRYSKSERLDSLDLRRSGAKR